MERQMCIRAPKDLSTQKTGWRGTGTWHVHILANAWLLTMVTVNPCPKQVPGGLCKCMAHIEVTGSVFAVIELLQLGLAKQYVLHLHMDTILPTSQH